MYFLILLIWYILAYIIGVIWFQLFVWEKIHLKISGKYIAIIIIFFFLSLLCVLWIKNPDIANRVQHALAGGTIMTLIWYLSYLSSWVKIRSFALWNILFLIAMFFGICNELLESILQLKFGLIFAPNLQDTWYDLWANSLGIILCASIFTLFEFQRKN